MRSVCGTKPLVSFQMEQRQTGQFVNRHQHPACIGQRIEQRVEIFAAALELIGFFEKAHVLVRGQTVTRCAVALVVCEQRINHLKVFVIQGEITVTCVLAHGLFQAFLAEIFDRIIKLAFRRRSAWFRYSS